MGKNQRKSGVVLSYLSEGIKILSGLIYTPIMLRLLGQTEYGLYQLVFSVVSYLSVLSMGFSSAYIRYYAKYNNENDNDSIERLNGMFMIIFSAISLICLVCGAIMLRNIDIIFNSGLTDVEINKAKVLMTFMIVDMSLNFLTSVFNCVTSAHEQFFFQKSIILLQNILNPFIALPLLILGYGSFGLVLVSTILTLARLIVNMYFSIHILKMKFQFRKMNFALLKEMWVFTFFIFLNQIIDQVNWSVDKFLLGRYSGTYAVAIYGLGGQLNTMYLQFSTTISNVFIPKVNELVAKSTNDNQLTNLFTKVGRIQFSIIALIVSGIIFFGKPFIHFWGGAGYEQSYYVTLLLIIPVTIPLIQNLGIEIQKAKNMHKTRSLVYFVMAVLNVFISIPLIKLYGASGAALGTTISMILGNVLFMNWYYHRRMRLNMLYFWKQILDFIPALIYPVFIGLIMMKYIHISTFTVLLLCIILYSTIYFISFWIRGFNEYEKNLLLPILKKIPVVRNLIYILG